jgi:hypothetical protein
MTNADLLRLPLDVQIVLASGYAAYALAYVGLRDRQRPIDIAFISLIFSLVASSVLGWLAPWGLAASGLIAFVASLVAGIVWRKFGRPYVFPVLRYFRITWFDDAPSALASLSDNTIFDVTQIAVLLDDDTWLICDNAAQFNEAPFGPFHIGPNGDIAMYVMRIDSPDGQEREQTRDIVAGDKITYIPASRIKRFTIRHFPKTNLLSLMDVVADSAPYRPEQL